MDKKVCILRENGSGEIQHAEILRRFAIGKAEMNDDGHTEDLGKLYASSETIIRILEANHTYDLIDSYVSSEQIIRITETVASGSPNMSAISSFVIHTSISGILTLPPSVILIIPLFIVMPF